MEQHGDLQLADMRYRAMHTDNVGALPKVLCCTCMKLALALTSQRLPHAASAAFAHRLLQTQALMEDSKYRHDPRCRDSEEPQKNQSYLGVEESYQCLLANQAVQGQAFTL